MIGENRVSLLSRRCRSAAVLVYCFGFLACAGCVSTIPVRATAYDIHVRLDPQTHELFGKTTVHLRRGDVLEADDPLADAPVADDGPVAVEFGLNGALVVERIVGNGAEVAKHSFRIVDVPSDHAGVVPELAVHRVVLDSAADEFTLTFEYAGELYQDVDAGEKPGQIHNFAMAAHVAGEGIYLEPSGGWYPTPYSESDDVADEELVDFHLTADPIDGIELVAGASPDDEAFNRTGQLTWNSSYPVDGMVLVGGPHRVKERQLGDIRLALHYTEPADAESKQMMDEHTDLFLDAAGKYLERYQPLVGPYPYERFTIVENFFSSGFAFPEFTLLNAVLLQMGPKALAHGYLDHEMLHSWWGNSIYVDPADGNWCEAITSYATNLYGYVLDGDEKGARKKRRDCCNFLSRIKPKNDKPLGTFGRKDGAGRGIGYSKGTMVFHMVARRIGQENYWAAMRRLTKEYTGKTASWDTLKELFEQESGVNLDRFFQEWVRSGGAPNLKLVDATWYADDHSLAVTIDQGETEFELRIPLRFVGEDGTFHEEVVKIDQRRATARIAMFDTPTSVVLDPDYHVFRKLQPAEIMPTTGTTRSGEKLLVITEKKDIHEFQQTVIDAFVGHDESMEVTRRTVKDLAAEDGATEELTTQSVLILGDAVRAEVVQAFLARTACPITWHDTGFTIDGKTYDDPGHSVVCTVHHPDVPDGGVTVYCGNSEDALGRSSLLLFYGNSLVVFKTDFTEEDGEKDYNSTVVTRRDFESQESIDVTK